MMSRRLDHGDLLLVAGVSALRGAAVAAVLSGEAPCQHVAEALQRGHGTGSDGDVLDVSGELGSLGNAAVAVPCIAQRRHCAVALRNGQGVVGKRVFIRRVAVEKHA